MISKTLSAFALCAFLQLGVSGLSPAALQAVVGGGGGIVGGVSEFLVADAEILLSKTLKVISAGEKEAEIKIIKVISATKQVVGGAKYEIKADLEINGETKENCVASIIEMPWVEKKEGGKGGKTEITCPGGHNKSYTHTVAKRQAPGSFETISNEEAAKALNKYLNKLVGGLSFKLDKVHSSSAQTVQGSLIKIKADLKSESGEVESCDIDLWEKSWEESDKAVEIKFNCTKLGEKIVYSKYIK
ncbi:hypothetical protein ACFFRR_000442 [Megaselia abdita]